MQVSRKADPGSFAQLVAGFLRSLYRRAKLRKQTQNTFFSLKIEGLADPRPRMLIHRIVLSKYCAQVLGKDGQKLLCLRELYARIKGDSRQH